MLNGRFPSASPALTHLHSIPRPAGYRLSSICFFPVLPKGEAILTSPFSRLNQTCPFILKAARLQAAWLSHQSRHGQIGLEGRAGICLKRL
jgi:hypothetical protein